MGARKRILTTREISYTNCEELPGDEVAPIFIYNSEEFIFINHVIYLLLHCRVDCKFARNKKNYLRIFVNLAQSLMFFF
jgi:hypothetical protein